MSMTNYLENKVLDHITGKTAFTAPTKLYLALLSTSSTEDAIGTELTTASYTRKPVTFDTATNGVITNATDIVFDVATEAWGTIPAIAVYDAETAGNALFYGDLTVSTEVSIDNQFIIKAGKLTITLD